MINHMGAYHVKHASRYRGTTARRRLVVAAVPGMVVGIAGSVICLPFWGWLAGWEVLAVLYLAGLWLRIGKANAAETARHATSEDPTVAFSDALLILASVASLGAVLGVFIMHLPSGGWMRVAQTTCIVMGLVVSWLMIHMVFALRYARLYYRGGRKSIDFHQVQAPRYSDFIYMAFTVGMTFQVSDTDIGDAIIRRTIIHHALLSYLFGTVILATAINLLVTLGS